MHSAPQDRRSNPRSQFQLPVIFSVPTEAKGITRDVSQGGMYFYTDAPLSIGQAVEFKVLMPFSAGKSTRALCKGTVVRIEAGARAAMDSLGVAVHITTIELEKRVLPVAWREFTKQEAQGA
ncbi:MAG: PilZ domain-containing protein [Terriglobales bacterium]